MKGPTPQIWYESILHNLAWVWTLVCHSKDFECSVFHIVRATMQGTFVARDHLGREPHVDMLWFKIIHIFMCFCRYGMFTMRSPWTQIVQLLPAVLFKAAMVDADRNAFAGYWIRLVSAHAWALEVHEAPNLVQEVCCVNQFACHYIEAVAKTAGPERDLSAGLEAGSIFCAFQIFQVFLLCTCLQFFSRSQSYGLQIFTSNWCMRQTVRYGDECIFNCI